MSKQSRPLLEQIEGSEADERSALFAAWKRVQLQRNRPGQITDLHVREFLFYLFAVDHKKSGVQLSHEAVAIKLECKPRSVRDIVKRAEHEFGLVRVDEDRYADGGQKPNLYSIDWDFVRAVNRGETTVHDRSKKTRPGDVTRQPPDVTRQPPDVTRQPPDVTRHPYKETPVLKPVLKPEEKTTTTESRADQETQVEGDQCGEWVVVVDALDLRQVSDVQGAVQAAKSRNLTVTDCVALIAGYDAEAVDFPHRLHRLFTGKAHLTQPTARASPDTVRHNSSAQQRHLDRECLRSAIVRECRAKKLSEAEIDLRVMEAWRKFDKDNPPPPYVPAKSHRTGVAPEDAASHKRKELLSRQLLEVET